jgi:hypothetical protein
MGGWTPPRRARFRRFGWDPVRWDPGRYSPPMDRARRMWLLTEPINAVVYFAPEHRQAQEEAGLVGGWMAYFASRSAPLGAASAELVTATFFNFAPALVRRAIPDAWALASPARVLEARYEAVGRALARLVGDFRDHVLAATDALQVAVDACDPAGRPLFAANAALPWPEEPHQRLWHATTLLREFRGDGHVAALLAAEIGGCEANVMAVAAGATTAEVVRPSRGWTDDEWAAATGRLADRGLVTEDGELTDAGRRLRAGIEERTDRLATAPWDHLAARMGTDEAALEARLRRLVDAINAAGTLRYPNPMGLPELPAAS